MAAKLRSILRRIHWSLLVRAIVFALAWFILPFWLFCLAALYLYFVPFFQGAKVFAPFFALLVLAYVAAPSFFFFLLLGALFYYLLLIKNWVLIDRKSAYELLIIILSFFLIRDFYGAFRLGFGAVALWWAWALAALISMLIYNFIRSFSLSSEEQGRERIAGWFSFVVIGEFLILGLLLPLDFIYQSVIIFLASVMVIDLVGKYCVRGISRTKVLATSLTVIALLTIVLASASWGV